MPSPLKKSFAAEQLSKRKKPPPTLLVVVIVVAVMVVGYVLYMRYVPEKIPDITQKPYIAVLPFKALSEEAETWFSDGITSDIIAFIQKINGIDVLPWGSVEEYKNSAKSMSEIVEELKGHGITHYIEGTINRRGNEVRILPTLVDVNTGKISWQNDYNREGIETLSTTGDIAQGISVELKIILTPEVIEAIEKLPTDNAEAYDLYLKGRFHWNKRTEEGFNLALDNFQQAIDKDPNYALAYSGMADSYNMLAIYGYMIGTDGYSLAKENAEKALEIDDKLAEAHASLASVFTFGSDYRNLNTAEREYKRAFELNPGYPSAHKWYAFLLSQKGQHTEALEEMKIALELDPLLLVNNADIIPFYGNLGRYDEAREQFNRAIELDPYYSNTYRKFGNVCILQGKYEEAEELLHKALELNPSGNVYNSLGNVYYLQGKYKEYEELMLGATKIYPSNTVIYTMLGEAYILQGKYNEAEKLLLEALEMNLNLKLIYYLLLQENGYDKDSHAFADIKKSLSDFVVKENEVNSWGYRSMRRGKIQEAIEIFKLNVELYPESSNVYDSLGEAYMNNGEKELAIKNYEKSIELNPQNIGGIEMLKKLKEQE
ncbi:tetratricopeptide repeat protein [Candidatus Latescibacterota bacterium]